MSLERSAQLQWKSQVALAHAGCLVRSYRHFTGCELVPACEDELELARRVFEAPFVVVSHGTEADPILTYGNASALKLWEMSWEEFVRTPSRLTAEAPNRAERARLLATVTRQGFIDDYVGVRISHHGRRFRIRQATVWNVFDKQGERYGQAATFSHWEWL